MRAKAVLLFLPTVAVICSLACLVHGQQTTIQPEAGMKGLKIGVISPQSGPAAFIGIAVLRGAELAVKNINEKGTSGKGPGGILVGNQRYKLEVASYDDSFDPAKSVAGMRRLVELNQVPVIVGPFGTPQVWACQEVNVQLGVLFDGMSQSDLSRKKGNPLYIQERVPTMYYGDPMAEACIEKGFRKACILTDISESYASHGKRFKQKFESLGGQVLAFETADAKTTTDYHSIMTSIKLKNPDIIFSAMFENGLPANHAFDVGYKGKFLFSSDFDKRTEKIIGLERLEGSLVQARPTTYYARYPEQDKRGHYAAFLKQCTQNNKEDLCVVADISYDQVWMFARAMEIANTVRDAYAIRSACPKALQEGKLPLLYPNNDVLKNGLMVGSADFLLEITGGGFKFVKELQVPKEVLE